MKKGLWGKQEEKSNGQEKGEKMWQARNIKNVEKKNMQTEARNSVCFDYRYVYTHTQRIYKAQQSIHDV